MRKLTSLSTIALLLFQTAFSQSNFLPGYIVTNDGDSSRGEIDYREWNYSPQSITFRQGANQVEYKIDQLQAFAIYGKDQYRRFHVTYHLSPITLGEAARSFGDETESGQVFLRSTYMGKISLYELNTQRRIYYFLQTDGAPPEELLYRVRVDDGVLIKDETYKNQIRAVSGDQYSSKFETRLEGIDYTERDLVSILRLLNNDGDQRGQAKTSKPAKIDATAGVSYYSYYFSRTATFHDMPVNSGLGYTAGAGITILSSREQGRIRTRFGLNFHYIPISGEPLTQPNTTQLSDDNYFFTLEPSLNIQVVLNPLAKNLFTIGPEFGYHFILSNKLETQTLLSNGTILYNNIPSKGGFMSAGINFSVAFSQHRISIKPHWLSDAIDEVRNALYSKCIAFSYSYQF